MPEEIVIVQVMVQEEVEQEQLVQMLETLMVVREVLVYQILFQVQLYFMQEEEVVVVQQEE